MKLRSLLFVPADRPDRFEKAAASGADALIIDLEDSVAPERKIFGRDAVAEWLAGVPGTPSFVRINPLDSGMTAGDLDALMANQPAGIVFPKAEGADSVDALMALWQNGAVPPILPIATETPAAIFQLGSYARVRQHLIGVTWGAEDLPAAIGAVSARELDGSYTPPLEMVRSLTLYAAHAAGVAAIETIFPRIDAPDALGSYVARARRDGFTGMMAIHPKQIDIINQGFTPSADEIAHAQAVVALFDANPGVGAMRLDGKMVDRPHLIQAQRILGMTASR